MQALGSSRASTETSHWLEQRLPSANSPHLPASIPTGSAILELGCGEGDLLGALQPAVGMGVDFSAEMLRKASEKYPSLTFIQEDAHKIDLIEQKFDYIILSDLVNELWDVQDVLSGLRKAKVQKKPESLSIVTAGSGNCRSGLRKY